jgi:hypothetical protein
LGGCSLDFSAQTEISVDAVVNSGTEMLSGMWNTTKEVSKEYYEEQIKPLVNTAKEEITNTTNQLKNQYNQQVEKINEQIQGQADQAKDQVNKLKVE